MSEEPAAAAGDWRRASPLSVLVASITGLRQAALALVAVFFGAREWQDGAAVTAAGLAFVLGVLGAASYLNWRQFRYRIGESDVRVERGLLNRTARSVPYERIQDVSVEQALVPRLFGMVEVKFETGAGGKDELKIGFITEAEGEALRQTVRSRKESAPVPAAAGDEPVRLQEQARTLFAMDLRRLVLFGVFEFSLVVFAVLGGAAQQFDFVLPFDIWDFDAWINFLAGPGHWLQGLGLLGQAVGLAIALSALGLVGLVTGLGRTVLRDYGFRLDETPKGLRRRRGLLTRSDVVMPLHRIQALKVTTGIVRRRFGWHGLQVVSLSQGAKSGKDVVVPFARMDEIAPVVETAGFSLPDGVIEWYRASIRQRNDSIVLTMVLFAGLAASVGWFLSRFAPVPAGLPMLAPAGLLLLGAFLTVREWFLWRHRRHAVDARQLFVRDGWLAPRLDIASRVKLQSVEIVQGPWARRRGYADVKFGVAGGTLAMHGVPVEEARAIRDAVLDSIAAVDFSRLPG